MAPSTDRLRGTPAYQESPGRIWVIGVSSFVRNEPNFHGRQNHPNSFPNKHLQICCGTRQQKRRTQFFRPEAGDRGPEGREQKTENEVQPPSQKRGHDAPQKTRHGPRVTSDESRQTKPIGVAVLSAAERIRAVSGPETPIEPKNKAKQSQLPPPKDARRTASHRSPIEPEPVICYRSGYRIVISMTALFQGTSC